MQARQLHSLSYVSSGITLHFLDSRILLIPPPPLLPVLSSYFSFMHCLRCHVNFSDTFTQKMCVTLLLCPCYPLCLDRLLLALQNALLPCAPALFVKQPFWSAALGPRPGSSPVARAALPSKQCCCLWELFALLGAAPSCLSGLFLS